MGQFGWHNEEMIKQHIENYQSIILSGYFVYEDKNWYVFAATPQYMNQVLSPTWIPKATVISIKKHEIS